MIAASSKAQPEARPGRIALTIRPVVDSTNRLAAEAALDEAPAWHTIQALEQKSGRGRRGRSWDSPPGNLYISTVLRPPCTLAESANLSFVAALAVRDCVAAFAPAASCTLKWPNDVLLDGLKVSGILCESIRDAAGTLAVIIGTGLNIAHYPDDSPYGATALNRMAGAVLSVDRVRDVYLAALLRRYEGWETQGFAPLREAWLTAAHGLGADVAIMREGQAELTGRFTGLAADGRLILTQPDGVSTLIESGSLRFAEGEGEGVSGESAR